MVYFKSHSALGQVTDGWPSLHSSQLSVSSVLTRAANQLSRRLKFQNHCWLKLPISDKCSHITSTMLNWHGK